MTATIGLLLLVVFLLGICLGILYEKQESAKKVVEEPMVPRTEWKRTRVASKKVDFGNQLDPISPEVTRRNPYKNEKEVEDDER